MSRRRRLVPLLVISAIALYLLFSSSGPIPRFLKSPFIRYGSSTVGNPSPLPVGSLPTTPKYPAKPLFTPGIPTPGHNYTRAVVMPQMPEEDVSWLGEINDLQKFIYHVKDPSLYISSDTDNVLRIPRNKGHEAMAYLTYIIDHYDNLPDVILFMHSHRWTWHNAELLDHDAFQMITALNYNRVIREGYVNLKCSWAPGCSDGIRLYNKGEEEQKQEKQSISKVWFELFPHIRPMPELIRQPCCAQFAVSRDLLLATPLATFVFYRNWLIRTPLGDYMSGRVFENTWHIIFTGEMEFCPDQRICYCDTYGVCMRNNIDYDLWFQWFVEAKMAREELSKWREKDATVKAATEAGDMEKLAKLAKLGLPEAGKDTFLEAKINAWEEEMTAMKKGALRRGQSAQLRAAIAGREWQEGDGF